MIFYTEPNVLLKYNIQIMELEIGTNIFQTDLII